MTQILATLAVGSQILFYRFSILLSDYYFYCPQAGQAFTFLLQPKKVNKKGRRCG